MSNPNNFSANWQILIRIGIKLLALYFVRFNFCTIHNTEQAAVLYVTEGSYRRVIELVPLKRSRDNNISSKHVHILLE